MKFKSLRTTKETVTRDLGSVPDIHTEAQNHL